jgi:hypothetical protein
MTKTWLLILLGLVSWNFAFAQNAASILRDAFSQTDSPLNKEVCDLLTISNNPVARPTFMKMPVEPPCFAQEFQMMFFSRPQFVLKPDFFMEAPAAVEEPVASTKPEPIENPDIIAHHFSVHVKPAKQDEPQPPAILLSSAELDITDVKLKWDKYQQDLTAYNQYKTNCEEYEKYHHYQLQKQKYEHYKTQEAKYQFYCARLKQYNDYLANLTQYENNEEAINKFLSYQLKEKYYTDIEEAKKISNPDKLLDIYREIRSLYWSYQNDKKSYQSYLEKKYLYERYLNLLQKGVKINGQYYRIEEFSCKVVDGFYNRGDSKTFQLSWCDRSAEWFLKMANEEYIRFDQNPDGSILAAWTRYSRDSEYHTGEAKASFRLVPVS